MKTIRNVLLTLLLAGVMYATPPCGLSGGISYGSGYIMRGNPTVHIIWTYNTSAWTGTAAAYRQQLIRDFTGHFTYGGGAARTNTPLSGYCDGSGNVPAHELLLDSTESTVASNANLTRSDVVGIVDYAINHTFSGYQPNDIYMVVLRSDQSQYGIYNGCAFHDAYDAGGSNGVMKFAVIGDPQPNVNCRGNASLYTPNNDQYGDMMCSYILHEIVEMITNPEPFSATLAWNNPEIVDPCSEVYNSGNGEVHPVSSFFYNSTSGGYYNQWYPSSTSGYPYGRTYWLQTIWNNTSGGFCGW